MTRPVAIVGVGQTRHVGRREDVNVQGLVREAVRGALEDVKLGSEQIDAVVLGSGPTGLEGINFIEKWLVSSVGAVGKPYCRVNTGGSVGGSTGIAAFYHVASGEFDLVLAVAFEKLSDGDPQYWMTNPWDPLWGREFAAGAPSLAALQATQYMARYPDITEADFAEIAVRHRRHALRNENAHLKLTLTLDDALNARLVASPLRLYDCCPVSDGACAIVFASGDRANELCEVPVWVTGAAAMGEAGFHPEQDLAYPMALRKSATIAYRKAEIDAPRTDIDVVEMYDAFSSQALIWSECLRFVDPGEGARISREGIGEFGSDIVINPSGGVLSSNPVGATGLIRQAEAALQLMGRAGPRQVEGARRAVAHAWGGYAQFHSVMVLSTEREGVAK